MSVGAKNPVGLEPVSFAKGRSAEPRRSPKRVPGRHSTRFWGADELRFLQDNYEAKGPQWCATHLPERTLGAIYQAAGKLGLQTPTVERMKCDPELDAKITAAWPNLSDKGALSRFAEELGVPRWVISKRALALGLTVRRSKEPEWSAIELELLRKVPLHDPELAARAFRAHGFRRTATAIKVRAKREGLSRRYKETLSASAAARILGVDIKWITARCFAGTLRADRRGTERLAQQGGDAWSIRHADLRQYVIDNIAEIDIRKVEKVAFVDLLTTTDGGKQ